MLVLVGKCATRRRLLLFKCTLRVGSTAQLGDGFSADRNVIYEKMGGQVWTLEFLVCDLESLE